MPKKSKGPTLGPDDMYVPAGMNVLARLLGDVEQGLPPKETPPSYSPLGVAVRDYAPGAPLKLGRSFRKNPYGQDQ